MERNPMAHFPQTPSFTGFNTPSRIEADIARPAVRGHDPARARRRVLPRAARSAVPAEARRRHRVQRRRDDHPVPFPRRPVRLPPALGADRQVEARARGGQGAVRRLPQPADRRSRRSRARSARTANTNAFPFAGKLWALKEDMPSAGHGPGDAWRPIGYETFGGKMTGQTFTAHPKIDPRDRQHGRDRLRRQRPVHRRRYYYEVSPEGELIREKWFKAPYYCMMHDFGITPDYLVLHIVPSIGIVGAARGEEAALRLRYHAAGLSRDHPAPRRHEAGGHPLVQARQLLRQPRAQRLAGGHQDPLRHARGEEQHVPVLPRRERRCRSTRWRRRAG